MCPESALPAPLLLALVFFRFCTALIRSPWACPLISSQWLWFPSAFNRRSMLCHVWFSFSFLGPDRRLYFCPYRSSVFPFDFSLFSLLQGWSLCAIVLGIIFSCLLPFVSVCCIDRPAMSLWNFSTYSTLVCICFMKSWVSLWFACSLPIYPHIVLCDGLVFAVCVFFILLIGLYTYNQFSISVVSILYPFFAVPGPYWSGLLLQFFLSHSPPRLMAYQVLCFDHLLPSSFSQGLWLSRFELYSFSSS